MSTLEIAQKFVALVREDRVVEAFDKLFSADAVSVEAAPLPSGQQETRGIAGIKGKHDWWVENNEVHSGNVEGPYPHGDRFAVRYSFDFTRKPTGQRIKMDEIALYTVKDGKIVREEFFYTT